jgi:hypothetical protein
MLRTRTTQKGKGECMLRWENIASNETHGEECTVRAAKSDPIAPNKAPNPGSGQKPESAWKTILGWAIGIGVVLLAAFQREFAHAQ